MKKKKTARENNPRRFFICLETFTKQDRLVISKEEESHVSKPKRISRDENRRA